MQNPTVDVIVPAFNAQTFIAEAIRSAKSQTHSPARIIVVDDGSTDCTAQVVRKEFDGDPSVVYVRKDNGGLSSARNRGIAEANADFIAFLDADDVWLPGKLSEQIDVFRKSADPKLGVVYCDYDNIDAAGGPLPDYPCFKLNPAVRGDVFTQLLSGNYIASSGSGVLIRGECFLTAGGFDELLPSCEDWDMWLRLARYYHFDYVAKPLVRLRRHGRTMQSDTRRMFRGYIMIFNKWSMEAAKSPALRRVWGRDYGVQIAAHIIREFPKTDLYAMLAEQASPELKRLAIRQAPLIAVDFCRGFLRRIYRALYNR